MTLRSFVLACLVGVALPAVVAAQCNPVPGTGCANALPVQCSGSPQIGQQMTVNCPPSLGTVGSSNFLVVGLCPPAPLALTPPLVCTTAPCMVGVNLGVSASVPVPTRGGVALAIPNDPRLVGLKLCMQCVTVMPTRGCLTLSQAVDFTIAP
jgi:hypothetical protein